jgi:CheY-like chemotaxis protein
VNARDAMPQGGKLTIETTNVVVDGLNVAEHWGAELGAYAGFSVSDTGVGMKSDVQARIFEPFFTTKPVDKGTGLGLSTVYGIVKQSGGHIAVSSEPHRGTTFKVYFPTVAAKPAPAERQSLPPATLEGSETVLLVEDDEAVRTIAAAILRRHGYRVLEARSGGDALLIGEQHAGPIHLLLTDVVMPLMSGRQLVQRIATVRRGIKVVFMSGHADDAMVRHGVLSSEFDFVQKPLVPSVLLAKLRAVLDANAPTA